MDKTPKGKSLRFIRSNDNKPNSNSSPVKEAKKQRFWNHEPDSQENVDVSWDWDSPKNIRPKVLRVKKREIQIHKSPILAPKKTSQKDHIKNYEKLKQELQALRDEIARTDDCLPLSPVDEQMFREESVNTDINSFIEEQYYHIENQEIEALKTEKQITKQCVNKTVNELFDDDYDEQLYLCTQMIEENLNGFNKTENYKINGNHTIYTNDVNKNIEISSSEKQHAQNSEDAGCSNFISVDLVNREKNLESKSIDDSFDALLLEFKDEDIDTLSQTTDKHSSIVPHKFQSKNTTNLSFKRTISDANVQYISQASAPPTLHKTGFQRTQSFDNDNLPKHVMEDIERKRKEALARLMERKDKEKRLLLTPTNSSSDNSIMKCSPDEIEKKRLQAKAIREAKQRDIIERNRQEAIRRLKMNRRKRMENSKTQ
ncbi:uncharacterized protein LOC123307258 [Coccinella septempunctata]|uniref:uncharacterized protein LOC123307258 n=1 Tax=Coccinella septempunctata TaxID=41139 RepID=UPI001D05E15C|nr:uncharacterized protein LOC123307258 [Coccinella septempunctata]